MTAPVEVEDDASNLGVYCRRVFVVVLVAFLTLAMFNVVGARTGLARAASAGVSVEVDYARVTRPGLAAKFAITITSDDPLPPEVDVSVSAAWIEMFDENGLDPDPSSSTADSDAIHWTFEAGDGAHELQVSFDARTEPSVQWGRDGWVEVDTGDEPIRVDFHTWVLP